MVSPTFANRIKALRLPLKVLSAACGLPMNTISRVAVGVVDPRQSTVERIDRALIAEELRLRDYLLSIHPIGDAS
jgi:predicted transcriptional regulator